MKLTATHSAPSKSAQERLGEKIIDPKALVKSIAVELQKNLRFELAQLDLDEKTAAEIRQSIEINDEQKDALKLTINHPLAADLEFGTRREDEQPWILRAIHKTTQAIKQQGPTRTNSR